MTLFTETGDERYFRQFQSAIAIPLADRAARRALEEDIPNLAAAHDGFLEGGNHPDDIPDLIWLFRDFGNVSYMATAIRLWREMDSALDEVKSLGDELHKDYPNSSASPDRINARLLQIEEVNRRLVPLALAFSESLGTGSRAVKYLLAVANILTSAVLIGLIIWHTGRLLKQRLAFEDALKAEKERAQVTLASLGEAVISTDADGCIDYMNHEAERLIGSTIGAAKGSSVAALFDIVEDDPTELSHQLIVQPLFDDATWRERLLVRRDATRCPYLSWARLSGRMARRLALYLFSMTGPKSGTLSGVFPGRRHMTH